MIHKYISKYIVLITRYAKENFRQCIQCAISCRSNTGREGKEEGRTGRRSKAYSGRTRIRIHPCKRDILQSERRKENTKEPRVISTFTLFLIFSLGFLVTTDIFTRIGLYYGVRTIWG